MAQRGVVRAIIGALGLSLTALLLVSPASHAALVPSPAAITLNPTCGPAGSTPQTYSIQVAGNNFNPILDVIVTFDAGSGGHPESFAATTDGFGQFALTITPTQRAAGTYVVRADDLREREATATFAVPCTPPPPPAQCTASLTLGPALARAGFVTQLTGSGFPPGVHTVTVAWDRGINAFAPIAVSSGGFNVSVLILPHDTPGPRTLRVTGADLPGADLSCATATFLVLPGSVQPNAFVVRR